MMDATNLATDPLGDLIAQVYESAVDPALAQQALQALARQLGAALVQVQERRLSDGQVLASTVMDDSPLHQSFQQQYLARWGASDPWPALLSALPSGEVRLCQDHFSEETVASSPFWQHFLVPHGLRWSVAGILHIEADRAAIVTAWGAVEAAPFGAAAAQWLRTVLPHMQRAWRMRDKAARQIRAGENAAALVRQMPVAYVLTDAAGRCLEDNEAFRQATEHLGMRQLTGRLRFQRSEQQAQWEAALQDVFATGVEQSVCVTASAGTPWTITVKPWLNPGRPGEETPARMLLALFQERAPQPMLTPEEVGRRARLTRAELEVLASLLRGVPAKTIAVDRGASVNTVRSQIMAILDKTGFSSQKELLASFGASGFTESTFGASSMQPRMRST